jgi:hypothetical protein
MKITHGIKLLTVVLLLGVLIVVAVTLAPTMEVTAGQSKSDVCHVTNVPEAGDGHVITIADPAWPAHEAHGDKFVTDPSVTVNEDGTCHVSECPEVPVAVDDEVTTPVDTPVTIDVLANDIYCDPVVVSVSPLPQDGILGIVDVGIFEYTPNAGYVGNDSFTYQITDTGGQSDTATVAITVGP